MKTIGLIGGTTWLSIIDYYRLLNEGVQKQLGGDNTARVIINSVNFQVIRDLTKVNNWKGVEKYICQLAKDLENGGANCLLLGANTLHKIADSLALKLNIPIIHIAKETAKLINSKSLKKIGLLGTKVTMTEDFYSSVMNDFSIELICPNEDEMDLINDSIFEEFSRGIFTNEMKKTYLKIIDNLINKGAEGIILGCTEIPILIKQEDCTIPLFDTTQIHVNAAIDFSLN